MVFRARQWGGIAVTLKIQSENSGVREPLARGRVEGLKAARIGLTSCPECYGAYDGYTTVGFKLKRPWACRWHGSSRMFLSSDPKVRLIFFNWSLATETLAVAFDPLQTRYINMEKRSYWNNRKLSSICIIFRYITSKLFQLQLLYLKSYQI